MDWILKLIEYPEYADRWQLRWEFFQKYVNQQDIGNAAKYARMTLESLSLAKKPNGTSDSDWQQTLTKVKQQCNLLIAMDAYKQKKYADAITSYENVLKIDRRQDIPHYYIGLSLWNLKKVEEAIDSFARCVVLEGEMGNQAKEHLENLYKPLHNQSTVGIEKVYRKARKDLGISESV
jgi:tetratricopeptide (TPR) repeat protein